MTETQKPLRRRASILAEQMDTADIKAAYDACAKALLANKIVLAWIMKYTLNEYKAYSVEEIAERYIEGEIQVSRIAVHRGKRKVDADDYNAQSVIGMNTEDRTAEEGMVTYDIYYRAIIPGNGKQVDMYLNVEAQKDFYPGYPIVKRGVYYCCRQISAQYGKVFTKSHYEKLKKVNSIWICTNPPKKWQNTISGYHMTGESIVGNQKEQKKNYDLVNVVMVCLGSPDDENYGGLLKLLDVLLTPTRNIETKKQILQEEFHIMMTETIEEEVKKMCNLSEGIEERGIRKGRKEGHKAGTLQALRKMMVNLNLTMEQAIEALEIPENERQSYIKMLQ